MNETKKKAKTNLASSREEEATAKGELEETIKEIDADAKSKQDLQAECMEKARDYDAASKSREEELEALVTAKKAIAESTGGAEKVTYGLSQTSLLQLRRRLRSPSLAGPTLAVVHRLRQLAREQQSTALTQLASRMSTAISISTMQGVDPFAKVRGMIQDLLTKVEKEAAEDSTHNAFCDKELSESKTKREEKDTEIEKLSTKLEQMGARSAKLKEQTAGLRSELAGIEKSQAQMDSLRKNEHNTFVKNKAELEDGLEGVRIALKALREFYGKSDHAHDASGSANSLIAMIEVCESDFAKGLSESTSAEVAAQEAYEEQTSDNHADTAAKEQAVSFKTKEAAGLDKAISEYTTDRAGVQEELNAVLEYLDKLKEKCIAKPDSYEERKTRRENELASLKEGLEILEGEEALVQGVTTRTLRQRTLAL